MTDYENPDLTGFRYRMGCRPIPGQTLAVMQVSVGPIVLMPSTSCVLTLDAEVTSPKPIPST